jgi:hypothetical protein
MITTQGIDYNLVASRLTTHATISLCGSRAAATEIQLTTHNSQLTAHCSLLTAHSFITFPGTILIPSAVIIAA